MVDAYEECERVIHAYNLDEKVLVSKCHRRFCLNLLSKANCKIVACIACSSIEVSHR